MVDEDEAEAVDMEMEDVVIVMVIEVIMKLTLVIEMMLNKEFDVEVDKEVTKEVFMVIMCEKFHAGNKTGCNSTKSSLVYLFKIPS